MHRTAHRHACNIRDSDHMHPLINMYSIKGDGNSLTILAEKSALNTGIRGSARGDLCFLGPFSLKPSYPAPTKGCSKLSPDVAMNIEGKMLSHIQLKTRMYQHCFTQCVRHEIQYQ